MWQTGSLWMAKKTLILKTYVNTAENYTAQIFLKKYCKHTPSQNVHGTQQKITQRKKIL